MDHGDTSLLKEAARTVASRTTIAPTVGVVLGSGLARFGELLTEAIPYQDVPGMPRSSVPGHPGFLRLGDIDGAKVACLQGRVHLYEGHSPAAVVYGVRLLAQLGCRVVLLTNAAGGIAPGLAAGDRMLLADHLNLTGQNPLVGASGLSLGGRFVDMGGVVKQKGEAVFGPYDRELGDLALAAAEEVGTRLHTGVYAGVLGPSYETPAEIRMLRVLGADAVGMSTVHEVIALRQLGVRVGAISCITNLAAGISAEPLNHIEVQRIAEKTGASFVQLLSRWVASAAKVAT